MASLGSSSSPDSPSSTDLKPEDRLPFEIGEWLVEPDRLRLSRGDDSQKLEPMAMRLLIFLAKRPSEVISRAEILREVWQGRTVVDEALSRGISLLRQALGDNVQEPNYIETIPTRGYRLIASVKRPTAEIAEDLLPAKSAQVSGMSRLQPTGQGRSWRLVLLAILLSLLALWLFGRRWDRPVEEDSAAPTAKGEESQRPGIVVLPFKNLSADPDNSYLAAGLTEELIHQLASVSGLRVVSRTSSMHFRDTVALAPEIAEILGVDYLLEGTVLVVDQRLRITVQLIQPELDDHLLSRSYDRDLSEVLDLQREVAKDVAENTRAQLSPTEAIRLTRERPVSSEAYRAYLRGHQLIQQRRELDRGLDLLKTSVVLAPDFAPAWAALADAFLLGHAYFGLSEDEAYSGAEDAIRRALELDSELSAAHTSLGLLRLQRNRDWSGSEASYLRAIECERSNATARQWYSELLSLAGRHEEALRQVRLALELDPLSPLVHAVVGQRLSAAGRYQDALGRFDAAEALGGDLPWLLREKAWALIRLDRVPEALEVLEDYVGKRKWVDDQGLAELKVAIREQGLIGYFTWELEDLLTRSQKRHGYSTWLAAAYAGTGQEEKALEWLAKAVRERNLWLPHFLKSPGFDGLRDDPRFTETLGDLPPWRPEADPSYE